MIVFKTMFKVSAFGHVVVFDSLDEAVAEIKMHVENGATDISLKTVPMSLDQYLALPEHEGY